MKMVSIAICLGLICAASQAHEVHVAAGDLADGRRIARSAVGRECSLSGRSARGSDDAGRRRHPVARRGLHAAARRDVADVRRGTGCVAHCDGIARAGRGWRRAAVGRGADDRDVGRAKRPHPVCGLCPDGRGEHPAGTPGRDRNFGDASFRDIPIAGARRRGRNRHRARDGSALADGEVRTRRSRSGHPSPVRGAQSQGERRPDRHRHPGPRFGVGSAGMPSRAAGRPGPALLRQCRPMG